ncbi:hypothetical protein WOLCODRAFT_161397 [Wolfiporia cocos MD-104 SS10]|uniref:Uncharacterized protein n=1 Tax=Wolfiporia cocos (strain MD-104) TaxID=742152 RepID=A0A2H3J7M7_WOLCO|nr:hypothetical protein WOLCODRAFT_161397 [Wolfiporia cocos MD-104 SS10]
MMAMAPPSRPRTPVSRVGLPAHPAPRSRSLNRGSPRDELPRPASRAEEFVPFRPAPEPPNSASTLPELRHSRSSTDVRVRTNGRARSVESRQHHRLAEPMPPLPLAPIPLQRVEYDPAARSPKSYAPSSFVGHRKRSDGSITSWGSSSGSSVVSQDSSMSYLSSVSSRTSIDDNADVQKTAETSQRVKMSENTAQADTSKPAVSAGTALWSRVTSAAGNLRVNVSKALSSTLSPDAGESTPQGQESRLTRAMKAYHVEKARDVNDLPDWLFDGRDREVIQRLRGSASTTSVEQKPVDALSPPSSYRRSPSVSRENVAVLPSTYRRSPSVSRENDGAPRPAWRPGHSRTSSASSAQSVHATVPPRDAMQRLKELRMAKRNARVHFADDAGGDDEDDEPRGRTNIRRPPTPDAPRGTPQDVPVVNNPSLLRRKPTGYILPVERRAPARVGLPTSVRPQRV